MYLGVDLDQIKVDEFPAEFSWDNIDGYDFTGRVVDQ